MPLDDLSSLSLSSQPMASKKKQCWKPWSYFITTLNNIRNAIKLAHQMYTKKPLNSEFRADLSWFKHQGALVLVIVCPFQSSVHFCATKTSWFYDLYCTIWYSDLFSRITKSSYLQWDHILLLINKNKPKKRTRWRLNCWWLDKQTWYNNLFLNL